MSTDGEKGKAASGRNVPWIEKYRPTTFPEIVGNQETVEHLKNIPSFNVDSLSGE